MIKSFANEITERIFQGIHTHTIRKEFPQGVIRQAERRLDILNSVQDLESLTLIPSMKAEAAVRDSHGKYSIPLMEGWRIAFRWNHENAEDVEIKE